ncbi:hypothetical protein JW935_08675 [candidate division KSB1 bacterium]|nr:hypothetical protein [candidate division KSB1 bacterium]
MAYFFHFKCTKCGIKVDTSGPHEINFSNGKIELLGHPGTNECDGLLIDVFCIDCKANKGIIVVAFKTRSDPWRQKKENIREEYLINYPKKMKIGDREHSDGLFDFDFISPTDDIFFTENYKKDLPCPTCMGKNVILFPVKNKKCPFCKTGILKPCDYYEIS